MLAAEIHEINEANGWNVMTPAAWPHERDREKMYRIGCVLALIHSEVSEALEAARKDDFANFAEEMADTLIRVLDVAYGLGIDLEQEVRAKLARNRTRGFRHGGKAV